MNMKHKLLWLGAILTLAIALGSYLYLGQIKKDNSLPQVFEFSGQVKSADTNSLVLNGVYDSKERPELTKIDQMMDVTVKITPQTKYLKTVLTLPSADQINAQHGAIRADQLKKEETSVDFQTFKTDVTTNKIIIGARSSQNIYNKQEFTATEFLYTLAQ